MIELKEAMHYVTDKIDVSSLKIKEYISTDNMVPNRGGIIDCESLPKANRVTRYEPGDILISNIRPYFKKIWFADRISGCSNDVIVFRTNNDNWNKKFLYYALSQDKFFDFMMASANGTKMPRGNKEIIPDFLVADYDIKRQTRIADILSTYDNLIKNNQQQIKLLEEVAQRLYKEWFVDLHYPGYEDVEIVDGVPKGWKQLVLSEIANVVMGQSPKSEFYNNEKKGLPFHQGVTSYGNRFVNDTVYTTSFTRIAEPGSILFSVRAPVGRLNITKNKIVIGRGLSAMNHKKGYQSYLFYLLKERFFKDNLVGNGSIFDSITKSELLSQKFLVPNEEILIRFNDITKNIDAKIAVIDAEINCLVEARDRLLPKLMSGEIEV